MLIDSAHTLPAWRPLNRPAPCRAGLRRHRGPRLPLLWQRRSSCRRRGAGRQRCLMAQRQAHPTLLACAWPQRLPAWVACPPACLDHAVPALWTTWQPVHTSMRLLVLPACRLCHGHSADLLPVHQCRQHRHRRGCCSRCRQRVQRRACAGRSQLGGSGHGLCHRRVAARVAQLPCWNAAGRGPVVGQSVACRAAPLKGLFPHACCSHCHRQRVSHCGHHRHSQRLRERHGILYRCRLCCSHGER